MTIYVWSNYGTLWGLLVGFLLMGGVDWKLIGALLLILFGLVQAPFRPGWRKFVKAWEPRLGDERRSAFAVPTQEVHAMRRAYRAWRKDHNDLSPGDWIEDRAEEYERQGFRRRLREGETRITSGWNYDIKTFDRRGHRSTHGAIFAATRSFKYERGGPMGGGWEYTHEERCGHAHGSHQEALACFGKLRDRGGEPTLADLEPKSPLLVGEGVYRGFTAADNFEGRVEVWEIGITVPQEPGKRLMLYWDQFERGHGGDQGAPASLILDIRGAEGPGGLRLIEVTGFGDEGKGAWVTLLAENGVVIQPSH